MFLSGVRIGLLVIAAVLRRILQVLLVGLTACFAAAAGTATLGTAAHPIASAMGLATATTVTACASPSPSNNSWASALSASKLSGYELMASDQKKRSAEKYYAYFYYLSVYLGLALSE